MPNYYVAKSYQEWEKLTDAYEKDGRMYIKLRNPNGNEKEARAEAEYVIENLKGYELQMPIACDVEDIDNGTGRMDNLSAVQRSKNVAVFCQTIKDAGYDAMIYCNMYYEAYKLNLELLSGFPMWYADYSRYPQTPYHFNIWQYTSSGKVNGIKGNVDFNIQMLDRDLP